MDDSPFLRRKAVYRREKTFWESNVVGTVESVKNTFVKAIPSDEVKRLPPSYIFPIGSVIFFLLLGIFVAVFVPGYVSQVKTKFLAPLDSGDSRYCEDVTISNTGSFLATRTGLWQGAEGFTFANGSYVLSATNFQITQAHFRDQMEAVYRDLRGIGRYAVGQNLGVNLLFWMSWAEVQEDFQSQRFTMTGTPLAVLNRAVTAGTVSSAQADCRAPATSSFNPSSGQMQVTYGLASYLANPNCSAAAPPRLFGDKPYIPTDTFTISFDVRTLVTCVALNSNIASPAALQPTVSGTVTHRNQTYPTTSYVDPRYPGMKPVACFYPNGTRNSPLCAMIIGTVYAVPVFNHAGSSFTRPVPCNCSYETQHSDILTNPFNLCNVFNFLTGFIFYPTEGMDPSPILELLLRYQTDDFYRSAGYTINALAFTAQFTAGFFGVSSPQRSTFASPQQRQDMYAFCHSNLYGPCSLVTFNSVDEDSSSTDWVVAQNYYQVTTGACSDSFSTTQEAWDHLIEQPYAPLTQQYQTCRNNPTTAFFNQAGVSAGNVSLLSPLGVLLVLALLGVYQFLSGTAIPRAYSREERDAALDALAVALLLVRDRRLGQGKPEGSGHNADSSGGSSKLQDGESGVAQSAPMAVLAELAEALAEAAAEAERNPCLQWQQETLGEPVHVDWGRLREKVLGREKRANPGNGIERSGSQEDGIGTTPAAAIPAGAVVAVGAEAGGRVDSDDDVELATISEIHAHR